MTCKIDYTANGSIVAFPFPFAIPADNALEVRVNGSVRDVGFRINCAGSADGGVVVFDNAPAEGDAISLRYLGAVTVGIDDAAAGHLTDKLVAGDNIVLSTVAEDSGFQRLRISATEPADMLKKSENLGDVPNKAVARSNLGVYSKAETDTADQSVRDAALLKTNNLAGLTDVAAARTNLDVYSKAEANLAGVTGEIRMFGGLSAPLGWLFCDGSAVGRQQYAALFAVIGTEFGNGDGLATFMLPDFRGRAPIGAGQGSGLTDRGRGSQLGAEVHALNVDELPSHRHGENSLTESGAVMAAHTAIVGSDVVYSVASLKFQNNAQAVGRLMTDNSGGNGAHNNMQPSLVVNFIIKA